MCFVHCDVRNESEERSGSSVGKQPGTDRQSPAHTRRWHRLGRDAGTIPKMPGAAATRRPVHGTHRDCTEGVRSPSTKNCITEGDYRLEVPALPTPKQGSPQAGREDTTSWAQFGRSQKKASCGMKCRATTGRFRSNDPTRTRIWRGSDALTDAASQPHHTGSMSGSNCAPGPQWYWSEISRLPGHSRVRFNIVDRLDCLNPHGWSTQTSQISWQTVWTVLCIQSAEGQTIWPDIGPCPGEWNDRVGSHTN